MCHDPDAAPPAIPDLPGLSNAPGDSAAPLFPVTAADCTLTSADGTLFAAHRAHPAALESTPETAARQGAVPESSAPQPATPPTAHLAPPTHPVTHLAQGSRRAAVLILPDNRGLTGFYRTLAAQLAARGHHVLAVDYYARTAGTDPAARADGFDPMRHLAACTRDTLVADIDAALADLRGHAADVFTLGFCFGGRLAFLTADARFALAGAAGFYGFPGELFGTPGPTQLAAGFTAPVLGLFGQDDAGITADHITAFAQALDTAGVRHDLVSYPGVGHSFFEEHADPAFTPFDAGSDSGSDSRLGSGFDPGGFDSGRRGNHGPSKARRAHDREHAVADAWHRVVAFIERAGEPGV